MPKKRNVPLQLEPLSDLLKWWRTTHVKGMLIGGLAVALLGRPRVTRDVDAVVLVKENRWSKFLEIGDRFSFVPRIPKLLDFALANRVLLLVHEKSGVHLDISLGGIVYEEQAVARAKIIKVGKLRLPVATPEDIVVMKAIAHRPNDQADIIGLLDAHSDLDMAYVKRWVDELAQALEMPEIYQDLDQLISRRKKRQ